MSPDPTDRGPKLSTKAAADRAGVSRSTWADYTAPRASRGGRRIAPAPDGREEVSGYPYWYAATVDAWLADRVGQGRRTDLIAPAAGEAPQARSRPPTQKG